MGNDGGTIPTRREILNLDGIKHRKQESQRVIDKSNDAINWKYCKLSSTKLIPSQVVSDHRGNLFNKESVLELLLLKKTGDQSREKTQFEYINSINDIMPLPNFSSVNIEPESGYCYLVPCGDINKVDLITELTKTVDELRCPVCNQITLQRDIIEINSHSEKILAKLDLRIKELNELGLYHNLHKLKKHKKTKKRKHVEEEEEEAQGAQGADDERGDKNYKFTKTNFAKTEKA